MPINLFGDEQEYNEKVKFERRNKSKIQKFKNTHHYEDAREPKYRSCKLCKHRISGHYHNKIYHKCELIGFSYSAATDIRLKKVCGLFMRRDKEGS